MSDEQKAGTFGFSIPILLAGCLAAVSANAHHSFNMFDMQGMMTIEGRVTEFRHVNPHGYLSIETTDESGETVIWEIEMISANGLNRRGITRDSVNPGDWVRVEARPPRNPARRFANGEVIRKLDGTEFVVAFATDRTDLEDPGPAVPAVASSIEGIWRTESALIDVVDPRLLAQWPLTEKGRATLAEYDGSQNPWINCVPYSPPILTLAPVDIRFEIGDSEVTMYLGPDAPYRTVSLRSEHADGLERTNEGHSIGWWEGDTLVIDTVGFSARELGHAFGVPSGTGKHLIERLSLSEDGTQLSYEYEVEDPEYLTAVATGSNVMHYRPDLTLERGGCDLEAAKRYLEIY